MENMVYDEEKDCYICQNGKEIIWVNDRANKTATGYVRTTSIYRCEDCKGCPCPERDPCHSPQCK